MHALHDKLHAALCNGAVGDALGAGYENLRDHQLDAHRHDLPMIASDNGPAGAITDDTAMTLAGIIAIDRAMEKLRTQPMNNSDTVQNLLAETHAAYLQWAAPQVTHKQERIDGAQAFLAAQALPPYPEAMECIRHTKGAGGSTLKSLGKLVIGETHLGMAPPASEPTPGCGGMMRVLPFAALAVASADKLDAFTLGCETARLTHPGTPEAILASGLISAMMATNLRYPGTTALGNMLKIEQAKLTVDPVRATAEDKGKRHVKLAIAVARAAASADRPPAPFTREMTDRVIEQYYEKARVMDPQNPLYQATPDKRAFQSMAVLVQVLYLAMQQEQRHWSVDETLSAAANHAGDSDSVAAIMGQLLGTKGLRTKRMGEIEPHYQRAVEAGHAMLDQTLERSRLQLLALDTGSQAHRR